jgi:hypothetical protein
MNLIKNIIKEIKKMDKHEFKELQRLYYQWQDNKCKETGGNLKYFLYYCAKNINLKKLKSKQLKFK